MRDFGKKRVKRRHRDRRQPHGTRVTKRLTHCFNATFWEVKAATAAASSNWQVNAAATLNEASQISAKTILKEKRNGKKKGEREKKKTHICRRQCSLFFSFFLLLKKCTHTLTHITFNTKYFVF